MYAMLTFIKLIIDDSGVSGGALDPVKNTSI